MLEIDQLAGLQQATAAVYVDPAVSRYAVTLASATRDLAAAASPTGRPTSRSAPARAARSACCTLRRALALLRGRAYVLPQDVRELAPDALRHRLVMSYQALAEDITADQVIEPVIDSVLMPRLDLARQAVA